MTPYYNKPTQEGLYQHHRAIAEAVAIDQVLYNVPGRTACDMLPDTVQRLSKIRNIIGIKEATGDVQRMIDIKQRVADDFVLLSGDDATTREFILQGGHGSISVTANVAPAQMAAMCQAALDGNADAAADIDAQIAELHKVLFVEANPIPVKWATTEMGLTGYVYTQDLARGLRVSERIQAGMIGLNRGAVSDPAAPFGGMKQSGLGREGASEGIYEFCETQYIATNW